MKWVKTHKGYIAYALLLFFLTTLGGIGTFLFGWEESLFQQKLAQEGVFTIATIIECNGYVGSRGFANTIYQFEAPHPDQVDSGTSRSKSYTNIDRTLTYLECRDLDERVTVRYLPRNPNQSRIIVPGEENRYVQRMYFYSKLAFALPWLLFLWQFIKRKTRHQWEPYMGWVKKIKDIVALVIAVFLLIGILVFWWYIS